MLTDVSCGKEKSLYNVPPNKILYCTHIYSIFLMTINLDYFVRNDKSCVNESRMRKLLDWGENCQKALSMVLRKHTGLQKSSQMSQDWMINNYVCCYKYNNNVFATLNRCLLGGFSA